MTLDYGAQRLHRRRVLAIAGLLLLALGLAVAIAFVIQDHASRMASARAWAASGPPCATGTAAALATDGGNEAQSFVYDGVRFTRLHGAVRCAEIGYDEGRSDREFPVCQFDHPGALSITTSKGVTVFVLPVLQAATIQVRNDTPTCVIGSTMEIA
jgi:hypothetical protein